MEQAKNVRNVTIIVAIAAAVYFVPRSGRVTSAVEGALWAGFYIAIAFSAMYLYRERRVAIHGLGDRHRALLYGGIALAVFEWIARRRMWETGFGELAWFALLACVVYAAMEVFRHSRSY